MSDDPHHHEPPETPTPMTVTRWDEGLWTWSCPHPEWRPGDTWDPVVWCTYLETPDATAVIDPQVPADPGDRQKFLDALDRDVERRQLPFVALVTLTLHIRSAVELVERYGGTLWLPAACSDATGVAQCVLAGGCRPVEGVVAHSIGCPVPEFVLVVEAHHAVVLGDIVCNTPNPTLAPPGWYDETPEMARWYREDACRQLAAAVPQDTRLVVCGHGAPVEGTGGRRPGGPWDLHPTG